MKKALLILLITFFTWNSFSQTPANALNFDGINDYVNLTNQTQTFNYNATSTFTIEFWIKPGNLLTSQTIIGKGSRTAGKGYIIRVFNNQISFRNRDVIIGGANTGISATNWSHVAVTYNATAVKIYINGVLKESGSLTITPHNGTASHKMFIGARRADNGNSNTRQRHFKGTLDDLRFWNVVKTESEIASSKDCSLVGTESNLVSYFKFDQGFDNQNNSTQTTLLNATNTLYNGTLNSFALTGTTSNFVNSTNMVNTCTLTVENITKNLNISVNPNPATDFITINTNNALHLKNAIIYDVTGKIVKTLNVSQNDSNIRYNLKQLNSGLYFIKILTEEGSITKKLLIK